MGGAVVAFPWRASSDVLLRAMIARHHVIARQRGRRDATYCVSMHYAQLSRCEEFIDLRRDLFQLIGGGRLTGRDGLERRPEQGTVDLVPDGGAHKVRLNCRQRD